MGWNEEVCGNCRFYDGEGWRRSRGSCGLLEALVGRWPVREQDKCLDFEWEDEE